MHSHSHFGLPTLAEKEAYQKAMYVRFAFIFFLLFLFILVLFDVIPVASAIADTLVDNFRENKGAGGVGYAFLCVVFAIVCVPSSLMALASGHIFETTVAGFFASYPGILVGATVSFWAGRLLFKGWIENELRHWLVFASISKVTQEKGFLVVVFGRLSPIPFGVLNYALSVSAISYKVFILASAVGLIPICALYAKAGAEFATYFREQAVKDNLYACTQAQNLCYPVHTRTYELDAATAFTSFEAYDQCLSQSACASTVSYNVSCITAAHTDDITTYVPNAKKLSDKCDYSKIKEDAEQLQCEYNNCDDVKTDKAVKAVTDDADKATECEVLSLLAATSKSSTTTLDEDELNDNARCLRELNESQEFWTRVVLPIFLFVTMCVLAAIGYLGLRKSGYLQTVYNLDRQRELLEAEKSAMAEAEMAGGSV